MVGGLGDEPDVRHRMRRRVAFDAVPAPKIVTRA
jgi:hypothetical protein